MAAAAAIEQQAVKDEQGEEEDDEGVKDAPEGRGIKRKLESAGEEEKPAEADGRHFRSKFRYSQWQAVRNHPYI